MFLVCFTNRAIRPVLWSDPSTPNTFAPFVYSGGTSTDASVPGAASTSAQHINDAGQLIGSFYDGVTYHSFLATPLGTGGAPAADPLATAAADGAAGLVPPADGAVVAMPDLGVPDPNAVLA
jgi:uncharacterized membrane protein